MMEGVYHVGEQLRWNLGFPQPNAGGAFAAMIVTALWALVLLPKWRKTAVIKFLLFIVGAIGAYSLAMTFSRGALVALVVSLFSCGGLIILKTRKEWRFVSLKLFSMVALLVVITQMVGLDQRMAPQEIVSGSSSSARLELWTGGLQMIHLRPISGWGVGESGKIYMNWFQRLDGTHKVAGMINSYLHIATERGLPFLMCILFPALTMVLVCIFGFLKSNTSKLSYAASLSSLGILVAFAIANFFSTLWVFKHLWWLPAFAVSITLADIFLARKIPLLLRAAKLGIMCTSALAACLFVVVAVAGYTSPISRMENGFLLIESSGEQHETFVVYGDESVLGSDYGKRVRELATKGISILAPEDNSTSGLPGQEFDLLLYCGAREPEFDFGAHQNTEIIFLNPLFSPPEKIESQNIKVILGSLRVASKQLPWIQSAQSEGWELQIIKGAGQDLRSRWPILLEIYYRTPISLKSQSKPI